MSSRSVEILSAGVRAAIYVTAFLWFLSWLALSLRPYDSGFAVEWPGWTGTAAVVLMAAGANLLLSCIGVFVWRGRGTPALFDPPRRFVAIGPYRCVRNPMYIGGLVLISGFGLWHRSVSILLMAVAALAIFHLLVLFHEEPSLEARFGDSYREYKRTVNRWWPRLWVGSGKPVGERSRSYR